MLGIYGIGFCIVAVLLIVAALSVVFSKTIINAAVSLIITFFSVAGVFLFLNADFLAVSQIIIYGVGIMIVLSFAIMLTVREQDHKLLVAGSIRTVFALLIAIGFFVLVAYAITDRFTSPLEQSGLVAMHPETVGELATIRRDGTAATLGRELLGRYVLPFEIVSLLLLAGIVGVVAVARKSDEPLVNPTTEKEELP